MSSSAICTRYIGDCRGRPTYSRTQAIYFFTGGDLWYKKNKDAKNNANFIDVPEVFHGGLLTMITVPDHSVHAIAINCNRSSDFPTNFKYWSLVGGSPHGDGVDVKPLQLARLMLFKKMTDLQSGVSDQALVAAAAAVEDGVDGGGGGAPETSVKIDAISQARKTAAAELLSDLYQQVQAQIERYAQRHPDNRDFRYISQSNPNFETYPHVDYLNTLKVYFYHDIGTNLPHWVHSDERIDHEAKLAVVMYWQHVFENNQLREYFDNNIELIYPISPDGDQKICKRVLKQIEDQSKKNTESAKKHAEFIKKEKKQFE